MTRMETEGVRAFLARLIEGDPEHDATTLARKIGRKDGYLRDFLNGRKDSLGASEVLRIESHFRLPAGTLMKGGRMEEIQRVPIGQEFEPDPSFEHDDNAAVAGRAHAGKLAPGEVPERNVVAGLGIGGTAEGVLVDGQVLDGVRAVWRLPPEFLRTELRSREGEVDFIAVDGDSMIPTLLPGDRVMINRSQNAPSPDGLYAIFDGIGISVKRLEIVKGSSPLRIRIKSDNPNHGTDEISANDLHVIGRVVCRVSRM